MPQGGSGRMLTTVGWIIVGLIIAVGAIGGAILDMWGFRYDNPAHGRKFDD